MIARHAFNAEWYGDEVGLVRDDAFFDLPEDQRRELLVPWAWVEARGPVDAARCARVGAAGFAQVDTQVNFRVGLARLASTPSLERLDVRFADEAPFDVPRERLADFEHERFAAIPGMTMERLNARYGAWAAALISEHPGTCMEVLEGGDVQGWFLSRRAERGLELTLAMLDRDARISGHTLYHKALFSYAQRGHRVGAAAFSVTNTAVMNIYAALDARFLAPSGCWLWCR